MRIISWNCNGGFRNKVHPILALNADICIIQECENPAQYDMQELLSYYPNYLWCGEKPFKGLGVFSRKEICISENPWPKFCLRYFISLNVNDQFNIIAVWACAPYIDEYYIYQNINQDRITSATIVMGDFNSNCIWDKQHGSRSHQQVVNELANKGLVSAYHFCTSDPQGKEQQATFYQYRKLSKSFHIDHCFVSPERIKSYHIESDTIHWLSYSDHLPITLEIFDQ